MPFDSDSLTLEEYNALQASPRGLEPSRPNFNLADTPPPLVEVLENSDSSGDDANGEGDQVRAQKGLRGPDYSPDIAIRAGTELPCDEPASPREDRLPSGGGSAATNDQPQMIGIEHKSYATSSSTQAFVEKAYGASRRASEKLNAALASSGQSLDVMYHGNVHHNSQQASWNDTFSPNGTPSSRLNGEGCRFQTNGVSPTLSSRGLNVRPPPRQSLPAIKTHPSSLSGQHDRDLGSETALTDSPALHRYAITPVDGHPSQTLAKLQNNSPPKTSTGTNTDARQTLPSLEKALTSTTDSNGMPYIEASPAVAHQSPGQVARFGPSPAPFSRTSPANPMSPPPFPVHASHWRATSQTSSASTPTEHNVALAVTPAPSFSGMSPVASVHTPLNTASETSGHLEDDLGDPNSMSPPQQDGGSVHGGFSSQTYKCIWPGCTAAPFQTQYLLNSHANVHSNTRPHFCPMKDCPRGPGGQGFKRKNEMIRHGLVHQSPGYVCPFCPDQQHKYPRPDNLQRHVRVHHGDKDRDDPSLREVLAQRPEGGNRGRRRRLGS